MQQRFHAGLLLNLDTQALRAHARRGPRQVGNIDDVDPVLHQHPRPLELAFAGDALGRDHLHHGDKGAAGNQRAEARSLGQRRGLRSRTQPALSLTCVMGDLLRAHRAQGGLHRPDMTGSGAAAAANKLHPGLDQLAGEAGHVLRRAEINVPPIHGARHAGIGHGDQGQVGGPRHALNGGEHGRRSHAAVAADSIRAPLGQSRGGRLRGRAVQAVGILIDRHHHQNRQRRGRGLRRKNGLLRLVQRGNGFDQQQIDAALRQAANLLRKGCARLIEADLSQRLQTHAQGTDGARNPGLSALLVGPLVHCLARQLGSGPVDLDHLVREAIALQTQGIGAKSIGLDNLRARLQIFLVDGSHQFRLGEIQFVVAAVDEDAASVQAGAHGPIAEHGPRSEDLCKPILHRVSLIMLSHPERESQPPLCYTWPFPHVRRVVILVRS